MSLEWEKKSVREYVHSNILAGNAERTRVWSEILVNLETASAIEELMSSKKSEQGS